MRTALILAFTAAGETKLLSGPETAYETQRARWTEICNATDHPNGVVRYELWADDRGRAKVCIPDASNSTSAASAAKSAEAKLAEKKKIAAMRRTNPDAADPDAEARAARKAERLAAKQANDKAHGITRAAPPAPATPPSAESVKPSSEPTPKPETPPAPPNPPAPNEPKRKK